MTALGWLQLLLFSVVLVALMVPLGTYMTRVLEGAPAFADRLFRPLEAAIYRLAGIEAEQEMDWREYAFALLLFSAASMLLTYLLERAQAWLPWNPQHLGGVEAVLAWNTAASFATNTNWQAYVPETTMSYFTQMVALAYHNFLSAACGTAVAIALLRGIGRAQARTLGNFWVDVTRVTLRVLLPLCTVYALLLVAQGVPQNLRPYTAARTLEAGRTQTIAQGPVASQEAIKMLGSNGGGFFNANSAHPFENPTPLTNFVEMLSIFLLPAALTVVLGRVLKSPRHGWAVFAAMYVLFVLGFAVLYRAESQPHPLLHGVDQASSAASPGGNMEGKEVRFGIPASALFAAVTTDASCGAVNSMHDSLSPLGGMVVMVNMLLGEVVFGGVGSGLYGMLVFVLLAVFIAGLMVGRTPEYLGKKIEAYDVKMAMLYVLVFPLLILALAALSVLSPGALASLGNGGPHGLSEILYAYTSAAANNGSAFGGLGANTGWYNLTLGLTMLAGRFLMMVPVLAIAGSLAAKKTVPASPGTFPVDTPLFTVLLIGVILILGALTFFPALSLGPILEHLLLRSGKLF